MNPYNDYYVTHTILYTLPPLIIEFVLETLGEVDAI